MPPFQLREEKREKSVVRALGVEDGEFNGKGNDMVLSGVRSLD